METSPAIKEIAKALKEWHELAITVTKDATNPHFRSKFASLDNIIETIRIPLASRGLSFAQFPDGDGLTTILMHISGEWIKATANLKLSKEDPQGQGSAYTYGRRYALAAALGLATEDDDDGHVASNKPATAGSATYRAVPPSQPVKTAPTATKPAPSKKDPNIELAAAKERVLSLLKLHNMPCHTKQDCEDSVFVLTGLMLEPANFELIAEMLSAKLEAKESQE